MIPVTTLCIFYASTRLTYFLSDRKPRLLMSCPSYPQQLNIEAQRSHPCFSCCAIEMMSSQDYSSAKIKTEKDWQKLTLLWKFMVQNTLLDQTVDLDVNVPEGYFVAKDDTLAEKVLRLKPMSSDIELLYMAGKGPLGDKALQVTVAHLSSGNPSIVAIDPTLLGLWWKVSLQLQWR
ncbi:hypothetical protein GQ600_2579 [Phytophthora cactorum]|nr:hypothetical protein GQ600_2579 [Phytophthora cactorum]